MVETITPVVHGGRARWLGAVALHALGATATAGLFGTGLGWVGAGLGAPWGRAGLLAVASVALVYALGRLPVPQLRRQVPDWWRTFFGRPVAAMLYGAGLGVGFLTYLAHGTLAAVAVAAVATGRPATGAIVMAPFGLVRGLSALTAWRSETPDTSGALVDRLASTTERLRRLANGAALLAVAASASVTAARAGSGGGWRVAAAALALAFGWAGSSKLAALARWRGALETHRLPPWLLPPATWVVPAAELGVPALILLGQPRAGAAWAIAMLVGFSLELLHSGRGTGRKPCGCFGSRRTVTVRAALGRNAILIAAAAVVVIAGRDAPVADWPGVPRAGELVPMLLATAGLGAVFVTAWRASVWLSTGRRL